MHEGFKVESTQEEIELIARFMKIEFSGDPIFLGARSLDKAGIPFSYGAAGNGTNEPKFHSSLDWIMPVIEKIEGIRFNGVGYIDFHIMPDAVLVQEQDEEGSPLVLINLSEGKGRIEEGPTLFTDRRRACYDAVIKILRWLNKNPYLRFQNEN